MKNDPIFIQDNTSSSSYLLDTNILIYALDSKSPFFTKTKDIFLKIKKGEIIAYVAQQNIIEAESVLTKAYKQNVIKVVQSLENVINSFQITIISPLSTTLYSFHQIVKQRIPSRMDLFDAYLCATMLDNSLSHILTNNESDFKGIKGISAVNPFKT